MIPIANPHAATLLRRGGQLALADVASRVVVFGHLAAQDLLGYESCGGAPAFLQSPFYLGHGHHCLGDEPLGLGRGQDQDARNLVIGISYLSCYAFDKCFSLLNVQQRRRG